MVQLPTKLSLIPCKFESSPPGNFNKYAGNILFLVLFHSKTKDVYDSVSPFHTKLQQQVLSISTHQLSFKYNPGKAQTISIKNKTTTKKSMKTLNS